MSVCAERAAYHSFDQRSELIETIRNGDKNVPE